MKLPVKLPETLPLFPIDGALLLPRGRLPLQVFEPRFLAMVDDCLKTDDRMIGLIQTEKGKGETTYQNVGCAGRIVGFSETADGRYMITLSGVSRYRPLDFRESFKPYLVTTPSWTGFERDVAGPEHDPEFPRDDFIPLLQKYFHMQELETDWENLSGAEDELLINSLSMLCPFEPEEKQALLEAADLKTRRETLQALMEMAIHAGSQKEQIQ
ncbi:LON peptidase substrate-binding domain-containing protein [Falsihalocynthiibacter arcticus]|uniref:ATP-dependent protease n=1 Tax=Falsihalocynthiibacter arcticus TaxID=1579316 RepID=A0A126UXL5_9RHOB|nr:LON peptidase substrate-binding domain-containing protein [Falsihalocynthiibacter arcticus]AML50794.1 ATP-dependent protease [Falsihalocynthiibacter arcticus]